MTSRSAFTARDDTNVCLPRVPTAGANRWPGPDGRSGGIRAPSVVDINLSGLCQLRCEFCWGPPHHVDTDRQLHDWLTLLRRLASDGTRRIVFTGGEPLIHDKIEALLKFSKSLGLVNTVSTNGILLRRRLGLLKYIDQLGVPLDSSSADAAELMRPRSSRYDAWSMALDAMGLAQSSGVPLIIRSVVARRNYRDVARIPDALAASGIRLTGGDVLYKLYQVMPSGPIAREIPPELWASGWAVSRKEVEAVANQIRANHENLTVTTQCYGDTQGRYFIVDPVGRAFGNTGSGDLSSDASVEYGNVFEDYESAIAAWRMAK
jgi:Fe-coproporphyrin III synthase